MTGDELACNTVRRLVLYKSSRSTEPGLEELRRESPEQKNIKALLCLYRDLVV